MWLCTPLLPDQVSRLVRIHSDDMEDINEAAAGQIVALFGVECSSGDTFTSGERITMESMHTPSPVMSLAVAPKGTEAGLRVSQRAHTHIYMFNFVR